MDFSSSSAMDNQIEEKQPIEDDSGTDPEKSGRLDGENQDGSPSFRKPEALERVSSAAGEPVSLPGMPVLDDVEAMSRVSSGPAYSAFSRRQKLWITIMGCFASFISPVTANIYFPALNPLAEDLGVSVSLINLSLTTYMIFQGLSPTFFGDFGDVAGRRPAFILGFFIYLLANIGLALQRDYAALMVLRAVQSAGSSGTIALVYALIADIASTAERGKYLGYVGAGINIGPTLGPVIGGLLSEYLGWPSIFWFLAIVVTVFLIPWTLTIPETCRSVVGNGSRPAQSWNRPWLEYVRKTNVVRQEDEGPKRKLRFPNPLTTLYVIWEKGMASILLINSIIYLCFILVAATLSTLLQEIYGYSDLEIGLCYLPYGAGCCLAVVAQGYILDWNYRRQASILGMPISRRRGDDLTNFPIESARIQPIYATVVLGTITLIGFGWALEAETSVAVPLVLLFFIGLFIPSSFSVLNTLIVDLRPDAPATATAANNLVRCFMGAIATSIIEYMIEGMGRGWCFTFLALLMAACLPWLWIVETRGPRWRKEKLQKEAERAG